MVSLPDDLLRTVDAEARRRGTTRSGLLQELAQDMLRQREPSASASDGRIGRRDPGHRPRRQRGRAGQGVAALAVSPSFLDASTILASEDPDDPNHADARRVLRGRDTVATLDLALYTVTNVAMRAWHDPSTARRLLGRLGVLADDGGLVRAETSLMATASELASEHDLSVYDAAYVAAARAWGGVLVSCDVRDLVAKGLARLPGDMPGG